MSILNIGNIPRRAHNYHPPQVQENTINHPIPPVVHINIIELARTNTTLIERDKYKKLEDITEHTKSVGHMISTVF